MNRHGGAGWIRALGVPLAAALHALGASAQPAASAAGDPRFIVQSLRIDGATLVDTDTLQAAAASILQREIGFADLEAARAAVEAVYHRRGWRLVRVRLPAQTLDGGSVRFEVLEPRLESVTVAADGEPAGRWRARLPALREGEVPNLGELDRQLSLANEHPAQQARVNFVVPPGGDGRTLRAELQARSGEPAAWTAFLDNSGNDSTGKLRYGLAYRHARWLDSDQQINLQIVSAPHDPDQPSRVTLAPSSRVRIAGLGWRLPLPAMAAFVDATLGHSSVDSGQLQDLFKVTGRGDTVQLKYTQLLQRIEGWQPRWFAALDWRRYDNRTEFGGFSLGQPLVLSPLSLGVSFTLPATPQQPRAINVYTLLAANLPRGSEAQAANFAADRAGSRRQYRLLRAGGSWQQALGNGSLSIGAEAQVSPDLLPSGEQFSAGGANSVRGFADRGIGGDSGARLQIEWTGPNLLTGEASLRLAGFVDAAWAKRNRPAVLERAQSSIASAGLGLRLAAGSWAARFDWGQAIHQRNGAPRVHGAGHLSVALTF
jgi:hemolysin activation/secretion protein